MEFRTEKKVRAWWGGLVWKTRGLAEQPAILTFEFIQASGNHRNPADFGCVGPHSHGYFKKACVYIAGAFDQDGPAKADIEDLGNDARSVSDVVIQFTYDGNTTTFKHSDG